MPYIACTLQLAHHSTIRIQSSITIHPNMNSLFGPLFGTEANTKRIFGTALNYITVLHGSAYIVVMAMHESMGNGNFGSVRTV